MTATAIPSPTSPARDAALAIELRAVAKRYGRFTALQNLDLDVPTGSIFGLVGPNGAGKTTTFAIVATLLKPTSGSVRVLGRDPLVDPYGVRRQMGYMPDGLGVYDDLTVEDYLRFFAAAYRIRPARWPELIDGLLELVALTGRRHGRVDSLSKGLKQRVSLARALIHDPELLVLDEPASGLDPRARTELRDLLLALRDMGKTILISSHILSELEDVCSHMAIIQDGGVLYSGTMASIDGRLADTRRIHVRFDDGTSERFEVADDVEQAGLLRRLVVDEARPVVEFVREGGDLEELFLSITKGVDE